MPKSNKTNKPNKNRKKKDEKAPFPSLLRQLREQYSISQEEIAKKLDVSRQTISDYQWGVTIPDIDTTCEIVDFFNERCGLNYTIDYWLGKEEISEGIEREKILIPNSIIENLKEYSIDKSLMLTLSFLLTQKDFLENLAAYLVYPYLTDFIKKDMDLEFFFEFQEKVSPDYPTVNRKYKYYDLIESLPLLAEKCKEPVMKSLEQNRDLLFEFLEYLKKNDISSVSPFEKVSRIMDSESEEQRKKRIKEQEEFDKEFAKNYKSKENLKLLEEYEAFKIANKKGVEKNEHTGTRKRKKI